MQILWKKTRLAPSKRSVNESRAVMPGENKRVKQTIAEYSEKKSPSVDTKKGKNDITSELGESIKSIILVSGKQRNEEMKETVCHNSVMESIEKEREKAASAKWTEKRKNSAIAVNCLTSIMSCVVRIFTIHTLPKFSQT